jgi:hypothetical protein
LDAGNIGEYTMYEYISGLDKLTRSDTVFETFLELLAISKSEPAFYRGFQEGFSELIKIFIEAS